MSRESAGSIDLEGSDILDSSDLPKMHDLDSSKSFDPLDLSRSGYDADKSVEVVKSPLYKKSLPPSSLEEAYKDLQYELDEERRGNILLSAKNDKLEL